MNTNEQDPIEWVRDTNKAFKLYKIAPEIRVKYITFIVDDEIRNNLDKTKNWHKLCDQI